ncbi:cell division protein FtsZ [Tepidimonas taiwanensis]|uniref:Cell division protein FtsZ n=1 Tax=Tepidimonas taiwanensis TaxID=307486 RepID=A0A554XDS3_9BURK|nr:cell division protein FtsZ [Tepidimonas taiwanensis]MCX7693800.1 cell division protein FtsZ [Tepidimonas taiwanensis]TSE33987.1 Cell division protein FtsZ [Tepidimonas taiwanensis]UBQ05034.1 cell division protein FtsZ [Tepidimonas taiwanensis]
MGIEMIEVEEFNRGTQIKVIGVGGGGSNAVEHMIQSRVQGVEFICANTDAQALARSSAHRLIQLGRTGLGAGSKPDKGREAALMAEADIREAIEGAHMLFITAGMGGGTGTGAAPVIARMAKEMGILTVGVVTKPFDWEGGRRMANAEEGLAELEQNVDSLIVVLNDKLHEELGEDVTQDEAFAAANDVLKNAVGGIAEIINVEALVNVDFEDVRTVMGEPGKAMMGTAVASGPDRARIAAEQAVACPLLEGVDMRGAKGVLVLISAAKGSLKLSESKLAMNTIRAFAAPDAHVIYGTAYDESLGDALRVTVVATGLSRNGQRQPLTVVQSQPQQGLRTGTDNMPFIPTLNQAVAGAGAAGGTGVASGAAGGNPAVPSVWRTRSAAARVEALASSGMDDFEIPAFLRKQAD